jgi:hypothetical protein
VVQRGVPGHVAEMFPVTVRFSGIALLLQRRQRRLRGDVAPDRDPLVNATGWKQSPALYVILASVVVLFVLVRMREPSQLDLDRAVAGRLRTA